MKWGLIILSLILLSISFYLLFYFNLIPMKSYSADDFGIETIYSTIDYNNNGADDFTDILAGAREYVAYQPVYKSGYYSGGYPPLEEGVCTDVIWYAFQYAGYDLKEMVDLDISLFPERYTSITIVDPNIDFRRVRNLEVFFEYNATSLTTDISKIEEWQPGDIVVFDGHIAIISDIRNSVGVPYIIHQSTRPVKEEDALQLYGEILGHYRWEVAD